MPLPRVIPAMADLTQDIAGPVPLTLLQEWAAGRQDVQRAASLLDDFRIRGIVVSTDTSGLSRMIEGRDLLDVLALISTPKTIIHAVGVAVGGRPIGTWVADNTEMFYNEAIDADVVLGAMAETQCRIVTSCQVGIGMAAHYGVFYEIGGGLYGRDATTVELLAEHEAGAGDILVTSSMTPGPGLTLRPRPDVISHDGSSVFLLERQPCMPLLPAIDIHYPHPYPPEFFALLSAVGEAPDPRAFKQEIYRRYLEDRVILFLAVDHDASDDGLPTLLDDLVINALMDSIVSSTPGATDHVAGLGGGIGILAFSTAAEAFDFAITIRARFAQNAMAVKIGIDKGPVLMFSNARGRSGIAGDPVNIASKISEDAGDVGRINMTSRVTAFLPELPDSVPFRIAVSGIALTGVFV